MIPQQEPPPPPLPPVPQPAPSPGKKGWIGVLAAVGLLLFKFKSLLVPVLKFFPILLKTGGTMFFTVWVYAMMWGWAFAAGFVVLIFIHELGHVIAARQVGVKVSAPVFIPFVGALILLKEAPQNAWAESKIAIGGPLLGSIGAAACYLLYPLTGNALFAALAYTGFLLNLFNLAPLSPLDGGRIVTALSPWLWLVGLVILGGLMVIHFNFIIFLVIVMSLPRLFSLFRGKTIEEINYFQVTPAQRWIMGTLYIGLAALLTIAMSAIPGQIAHHVSR